MDLQWVSLFSVLICGLNCLAHCAPASTLLPEIVLQKDQSYVLADSRFLHSVGGEKISERTKVQLKYGDHFLEINFECLDNPWVGQNSFTEEYLEIEINPNNALFIGKVTNRYKGDGTFACWSSTGTKTPQFHTLERFGYLYLQ